MENIYFISDYKPAIKSTITHLGLPEAQVISYTKGDNESCYHDWTSLMFKNRNIQKLIIPISLPSDTLNAEGLKIALHIRLNYELSMKERLTPIVFLSDFERDTILMKNNFDKDSNPQYLLFTKGVTFSSFDIAEIKKRVAEVNSCPENEYRENILNKLKIAPKASIGKHSIANAWGCHKLAFISGNKAVLENKEIAGDLKTLYAKYLICLNETFSDKLFCDLYPLKATNKKVLFIDDQADEGWGDLMGKIFSGNDFVCVDSGKYKNQETKQFHDFEGFYEECTSHIGKDWDLIIIDLRLHPEKEDMDKDMISPTKLTGYELLDKFLSANAGYQIIVFTASNKIWNINAALKRGAHSYYIKESPEFNYSFQESREQYRIFKEDVKNCFKRDFLKKLYCSIKKIIQTIDNLSTYPNDFKAELKNQFQLFWDMILSAKTKNQFAFSYVILYMVIEILNKHLIRHNIQNDKWEIIGSNALLDWEWDDLQQKCVNSGTDITGYNCPEWKKFAGIYFQKWLGTDHQLVYDIKFLIRKRNGFIHNDKSIMNEKDNQRQYFNRDIYTKTGVIKLFDAVEKIIGFLSCA